MTDTIGFSVGAVARRLGVAPSTLRTWNRRYGIGAGELNRAKAYSRVGMGRCQGRFCGAAAAEVLSAALTSDVGSVGRLRGQPPVKPLPAGVL